MAERRMFAKTIIDSDAFLDMPVTARLLYYDLAMRADDDGFVNNPKKIMRVVGASQDDLTLLCVKKFVIPFESGIVVIKHWKIHNYIQRDRYKPTKYEDERARLTVKDNGAYSLNSECIQNVSKMDTTCIQNGYNMDTQVRLGKDRLGKDSISICADAPTPTPESKRRQVFIPPTIEEVQAYCKEHNKPIDVEAFIAYYGSQGWKKANGQKLSSWELAVSQWYRRDCESGKAKKPETSYDLNVIEQSSFDLYKDLK